MKNKPKHIGYQTAIEFYCDNCGIKSWSKKSQYERKKRHFCSMACYSKFRSDKMNFTEQHSYKGVRQEGESKQVYHRNYCKKNRSKINHLKSIRYAREKGASGTHTLTEWEDLKCRFNFTCAKCGLKKDLTKDHIIPLSKGGSNFISNIQPLCKNCNSKKHNKIENPEQLFEKYPNLDFDNGNLYKSPKHAIPLYFDDKANDVVASFFDGREITIPHSSGNPELDEFRSVNGHVFIEYYYGGSYAEAFKSIKDGR